MTFRCIVWIVALILFVSCGTGDQVEALKKRKIYRMTEVLHVLQIDDAKGAGHGDRPVEDTYSDIDKHLGLPSGSVKQIYDDGLRRGWRQQDISLVVAASNETRARAKIKRAPWTLADIAAVVGLARDPTASSQTDAAAGSSAEAVAPLYAEGDQWEFRVTSTQQQLPGGQPRRDEYEYDVRFSTVGARVFRRQAGETREVTQTRDILPRLLYTDQASTFLVFPLRLDNKWTGTLQDWGGVRADTHVTGSEEVTTPAGRFSAFKLERVEGRERSPVKRVSTFYFSPATKSIVRFNEFVWSGSLITGELEIELVALRIK